MKATMTKAEYQEFVEAVDEIKRKLISILIIV